MQIETKIIGDDTLIKILRDFPIKLDKEMERVFFDYGNQMRNHIITSMKKTPRASWFYKRQKGKKKHYPSQPGNFPAIDGGRLIASIKFYNTGQFLEVGAIQDVPYAKYLEKGTKNMEARPFVEPTYKKFNERVRRAILNTVKDSLRK